MCVYIYILCKSFIHLLAGTKNFIHFLSSHKHPIWQPILYHFDPLSSKAENMSRYMCWADRVSGCTSCSRLPTSRLWKLGFETTNYVLLHSYAMASDYFKEEKSGESSGWEGECVCKRESQYYWEMSHGLEGGDARCFDRDRNACGLTYIRRLQRGRGWERELCSLRK